MKQLYKILCIIHTKNLINENLKLLCENIELVDNEIFRVLLQQHLIRTLKIQIKFLIVLSRIKKDLMRHVNSEVEKLKELLITNSLLLENLSKF